MKKPKIYVIIFITTYFGGFLSEGGKATMSKAVTPDEGKEFHRLYAQYGSYAKAARRAGRSA